MSTIDKLAFLYLCIRKRWHYWGWIFKRLFQNSIWGLFITVPISENTHVSFIYPEGIYIHFSIQSIKNISFDIFQFSNYYIMFIHFPCIIIHFEFSHSFRIYCIYMYFLSPIYTADLFISGLCYVSFYSHKIISKPLNLLTLMTFFVILKPG